ncbi:hypothetical protein J8F10_06490 [Gemmata sp. G18]|uniref:Uncharacterized protein n=1 Tax=Gemmata palustris TaxID=2822762 RepID=A0ABS5BPZ3_9BACT|nr:hypothetical protein [Gemmata palustris]MBP3954928.1 hypothetical protein [Gemmata palustris]
MKPLLRPATKEEYDELLRNLTWDTKSKHWQRPFEWLIDMWTKLENEPVDTESREQQKTIMNMLNRVVNRDENYLSKFREESLWDAYGAYIREHGIDWSFVLKERFHDFYYEVVTWFEIFPDLNTIVDLLKKWAWVAHPDFRVGDQGDFGILADYIEEKGEGMWAERFRHYANWTNNQSPRG